MSLTLKAFALRVCYYLGYYEEKVKELEAKIAILEEQNELLGSTECLYVEHCPIEGCKNWWINGDHDDRILKNKEYRFCDNCFNGVCEEHAIERGWIFVTEVHHGKDFKCYYCSECKHKLE